ncbi:hypothetical protein P5V15_014047 [Pogonomyrmex californicus]
MSLIGIPKPSLLFRKKRNGLKIFRILRYQNTYRLEAYKPFKCEIVDAILIDVMRDYLTGLSISDLQICQKMLEEVRNKICRKYKIVVAISIVQKLEQIDFGKLWDVQRDTYLIHVIGIRNLLRRALLYLLRMNILLRMNMNIRKKKSIKRFYDSHQ